MPDPCSRDLRKISAALFPAREGHMVVVVGLEDAIRGITEGDIADQDGAETRIAGRTPPFILLWLVSDASLFYTTCDPL